ncbi:MAG: MBL fold metallo-hydrolase [Alistipes senegalensis]|nr:MBL fold metallo-hydrolase [Bacteroides cellulosilyticus]MCM1352892.1 MBL fold metallo-hydrolase [Alistipes senegalensis]
MEKQTSIQLIRNATLKIKYAGRTILVDPMLAEKASLISALGVNLSPRVHLTVPMDEIIGDVDLALLTHNHLDHYDPSVKEHLPHDILFLTQPQDCETLRNDGFTNVAAVDNTFEVDGITITRISGKHGRGMLGDMMGPVSSFVFNHEGLPTLYVMGDCCWDDTIRNAVERFSPDCMVVNCGGAIIPVYSGYFGSIITNENEMAEIMKECTGVGKFIAVHMDAIDHCQTTRAILRNEIEHRNLDMNRLIIPQDGEVVRL